MAVLQVSDPPSLLLVLLLVLLLLVLLLLLFGVGVWIIYEAATSPSDEHKQVTLVVVTEA